jgi:hypothetical protein
MVDCGLVYFVRAFKIIDPLIFKSRKRANRGNG